MQSRLVARKVTEMGARGSILEGFGITLGSLLAPNGHPEAVWEGPGEREEFGCIFGAVGTGFPRGRGSVPERQFGSPTGRTTGGEEESIHPRRLLTPRGRRIYIYIYIYVYIYIYI